MAVLKFKCVKSSEQEPWRSCIGELCIICHETPRGEVYKRKNSNRITRTHYIVIIKFASICIGDFPTEDAILQLMV